MFVRDDPRGESGAALFGRELAGAEQPLQRGSRRAGAIAGVFYVCDGERAAFADLAEDSFNVLGVGRGEFLFLVLGVVHAVAHQLRQFDRHHEGDVAPVLEQIRLPAEREPVERRFVARAETGEDRQVMRSLQHVHGVDWQEADAVRPPAQVDFSATFVHRLLLPSS